MNVLVCRDQVNCPKKQKLDLRVSGLVRRTRDSYRIPTNSSAESRSGWTKILQAYEADHSNLALMLLFKRSEVENGKGLFIGNNLGKIFKSRNSQLESWAYHKYLNPRFGYHFHKQ